MFDLEILTFPKLCVMQYYCDIVALANTGAGKCQPLKQEWLNILCGLSLAWPKTLQNQTNKTRIETQRQTATNRTTPRTPEHGAVSTKPLLNRPQIYHQTGRGATLSAHAAAPSSPTGANMGRIRAQHAQCRHSLALADGARCLESHPSCRTRPRSCSSSLTWQ